MPDEILRMRATVQSDEALAQIRQLGRAFGLLPTQAKPHVDTLTMSFTRLGTAIRQVGGEMRTAVPALGGIGLGAAGAGAALYALGRTFSNVADRVVELKYRSKELGMSERELRAWSFAVERVGVSGDAMLQGLQNFKTMTDGLKYNLGGVRDHLYSIGAGPVVQQMQAATTQAEKLKVAFAFKDALNKEDPTGFKARQAFIELGLGAEAARLSLEEYNEAQGHIKERTPAQVAAAKAYRDQLLLLKETWDDFITKQGITLFPALESELVTLGKVLDYLNSIKSWRDAWDNLPKELFDFKLGDPSRGIRELQELEQKRGGFKSEGDNPLLAVPGGGTMGGYSPISYSDGFRGGGGAGLSEGSRMVKDGVFAALVDFQSYVQAGAGTTSADGFQKASFGGFGSGGGAPGGGGGGPPVTGGGGGPMGMGGTSGGGGTQGGSGPDAQPGGGTPSSGPGQIPGTGSVPHEVMAEAKNLLQRGASTGQLQQFMASKGYPKAGAWCGEFAASVVKSAGGTPPKGAATASNWLGWGQHVDPKDVQEGDIAVRTRSRFGGRVIPGRTGGHVGLVGKVGEKTFERIGGNQGKPSVDTSRYSGEYEFRRGVPSDSPDGRKTATGPSTDASVLQQLADEGHNLPVLLMEYREIAKLATRLIS